MKTISLNRLKSYNFLRNDNPSRYIEIQHDFQAVQTCDMHPDQESVKCSTAMDQSLFFLTGLYSMYSFKQNSQNVCWIENNHCIGRCFCTNSLIFYNHCVGWKMTANLSDVWARIVHMICDGTACYDGAPFLSYHCTHEQKRWGPH